MKRILLATLIFICSIQNISFSQVKKTTFINKLKCSNYLSKGSEKYNLGRTYDALMIYKQALNVDPNSWKAYYSLATTEYDLNNFSDAKQHIDSSISLSSGKADGDI